MGAIASLITSLTIVYSTVYSDADQRKHQSSASLAFVWGIHRGPVNYPHKWPVTRKMFPFDDGIMDALKTDIELYGILLNCHWKARTTPFDEDEDDDDVIWGGRGRRWHSIKIRTTTTATTMRRRTLPRGYYWLDCTSPSTISPS